MALCDETVRLRWDGLFGGGTRRVDGQLEVEHDICGGAHRNQFSLVLYYLRPTTERYSIFETE